ncbi:metal ABC transporter ATP-binding protein [Flammeovirgaceae bacterium SG7u.111]|nr:metal ABC transporter ATP-binding protein [Flammeovirgaceae bacterium SG7u.132]WPO38131.1 metal ABC transporter ATP-binding protein [Flammeovirgaceae bacterium SG7u.111]
MEELKREDRALELHNLTVTYDSKPAVWNIDYKLPKGKLIGIIGSNGSGKTTMLKSIMGLVKPSSGFVKVFNKPLVATREKVAYVPQRKSVDWEFPASVFDTVLMGRLNKKKLFSRTSAKDKEIALECIAKVQLEKFKNRQISQLSGGQQQRVFIARALAQEAELYLLDEPFAGVDAATENSIMDLLKEMRDEGKTIIVVHHDLQTAPEYFDWLVMVNTRLVAVGPAEEVFNEENLNDTYGGRLNILAKVADLMKQFKHPVREK